MRDKETITIPLKRISYDDLLKLSIEQNTQLFVKDKEIERLNDEIIQLKMVICKRNLADELEDILEDK